MSTTYVEAVPQLMVSRKLDRWVRSASPETQSLFEAARLFAEQVLPTAVGRLQPFEPLIVFFYESLLIIVFDKIRERFCIASFFTDHSEPTPPDGPRPPSRRQPLAHSVLQAMGAIGDRTPIFDPMIEQPLRERDVDGRRPSGAAASAADACLLRSGLNLDSLGRGRRSAFPQLTSERGFPKPRSKSFGTASSVCSGGSAPLLLYRRLRILCSTCRRDDGQLADELIL